MTDELDEIRYLIWNLVSHYENDHPDVDQTRECRFAIETIEEIEALIEKRERAARIEEWHKMVEFMTPPEMHEDWTWPCKFCGLSPITIDNERLRQLQDEKDG